MRKSNIVFRVTMPILAVLLTTCCVGTARAGEYRAFWVDAWGDGVLNQTQVNTLLGQVGNASSLGQIREANCNTVIVQVRRNCDANYPSSMGEPYMSGLTPANFNSLQAVINAAHDTTGGKKRIEVHAWIVTFRTSGGLVYTQHSDTPTGSLTNLDNYWPTRTSAGTETSDKAFDPGHPLAEEYTVNVCMDIITNFDVDGLNYDYIRFTAGDQGYNPTSIARYNARYGLTGQPSSTDDQFDQWRRDQISNLVRKVYAKTQAVKPHVKISGSTVTWNPSPTASTRAAFMTTRPYGNRTDGVFSDWDAWMQEGILDLNVPMTYYNYATYPSDWTRWMNFIKDRQFNRQAIIGPGIYLNSLSNAILEIQQTRNASPAGKYAAGFCGYSYRVPYASGTWAGFSPTLVSQVTPTWDDVPDMPWKSSPTKGHISGTVTDGATSKWIDGATVSITGPESRTMLTDGTGFYAFIDLTPGTYTVTASKSGYPSSVRSVVVALGSVTGNMYVTDLSLGETPVPVISNVQSSGLTNTAATITWTTNLASSSRVEYGTTIAYGSMTPLDGTPVTSHSVALSGLTPNTPYHYRVISANVNGTATSGDYTFTTLGPPTITSGPVASTTASSATITWTTDWPSNGVVTYGLTSSYGSQASDLNTSTTSHSVTITGLTPTTLYHYTCSSTNAYGTAQTADLTFSTAAVSSDIIVDNTDPGWTNTSTNPSNTWTIASVAGVPKIGTNYLYRNGDGSLSEIASTRKCRWTPNIPAAGTYDVYVFYQLGTNRNESAPFKVYYSGGVVTSVQNQYSTLANQGDWFLIGQDLPFAAGTGGYVEVTTMSLDTKLVSADAAKWVLKSAADTTPPIMTSVEDEKYTTSTTSLNASWSATEPDGTIVRYDYAVGSFPGLADLKGWTSAGNATSATIGGLNLAVGGTYFVSVRAVNDQQLVSDPVNSDGVTVAYSVSSIAEAKGMPDGTPVAIPVTSVSEKFATAFYMQGADRASGIRVESGNGPGKNYTVQVFGRLALVNGCERALTDCKIVAGNIGTAVEPLFLRTTAAGGQAFGSHTPGMTSGIGVHNVGLLVSLAGRVTALTADGFYLDDGAGLKDDSGNNGIKVWTGAPNSATLNQYYLVTGVVSCRTGTGDAIYAQILSGDVLSR